MRDLSKVVAAVEREIRMMPKCNHRKFRIEVDSYLPDMADADDATFTRLAGKLWERTLMNRNRDTSAAPPLICRRPDESTEDYLCRIYNTGGYYHAGK